MAADKVTVAVAGASGYAGGEVLRLLLSHPGVEIGALTAASSAGTALGAHHPHLVPLAGRVLQPTTTETLSGHDVVFLGLPHGESQKLVPQLRGKVKHIIDLAADFRLKDAGLYPQWYGEAHHNPDLLDEFVYGLPELFRSTLIGASAVAVPGCYVTAASLALAPLVRNGLIEPTGIVVDAASGVSGAGRALKANTTFCAVDEDFTAYGLLDHRHTPEIEQNLSYGADGTALANKAQVLFTPHLAPMNRGILATCYARPVGASPNTAQLLELFRQTYHGEPFIVVDQRSPSTKATLGSNSTHLTVRFDERTGWIMAIAALDNLTKGASGQAVQCANLATGLPETLGLDAAVLYP